MDHLGATAYLRGHRRRRDSGRAHFTGNAQPVRAQRRLFPRRAPFWIHSVFLSRCRGDRYLAALQRTPRALAYSDVPHVRDLCCRAAARAAVHVERGGGPPGNRYLLSVYPTLFFLVSPIESTWPGLVSWMGGTLFTARMLVSPFVAAGFPWLATEHGPARLLPVELTMANDLPARLAPSRTLIPYGQDPALRSVFPRSERLPAGTARHVGFRRRHERISSFDRSILSTISWSRPNRRSAPLSRCRWGVPTVTRQNRTRKSRPSKSLHRGPAAFAATRASAQRAVVGGFVPHLSDPASRDYRNLGVQLRFQAVTTR